MLKETLCAWTHCFSVLPQYFLCSCAFVQKYLPWKSSKYYIFRYCVCILIYPKCNTLAPYCHKGPLLQYSILPPYILIDRIFQEMLLNVLLCIEFFTKFFWNVLVEKMLNDKWKNTFIGVHVKYPFCYFETRVVPCARREIWANILNLTVDLPNFEKSINKLKSYNTNVLNFQVEILYGSSPPGWI